MRAEGFGELHPKRRKILQLLARVASGRGEVPTEREVGQRLGFRSSQTAHYHLRKLEEEGYIERLEAPSRKRRPVRLTEKGWQEAGQMPVLGRIAAGPGMEAVPVGESASLASDLFGPGRFLLEARGQSMSGAGIEDGDLLLVVADPSPPDGTIVAALLGGEKVTVKRLYREEGGTVRLRAENGEYADIVTPASGVEIQGRVELILRKPWRR